MDTTAPDPAAAILASLPALLPALEGAYEDIHAHPELSMQGVHTAGIVAKHLSDSGYEVTGGVGHTGVVGLLRNGQGPTVMLLADMDALPIGEETGLDYASHQTRNDGSGESVPGLLTRFPKPDVVLGQHVMMGPAGMITGRDGPITAAADNLRIRLFGRGAHGSMPQASVDPIVMAASLVLRLQTIVSREIAATDAAVVTVGVIQAGTRANVIPDEAILELDVRTFDEGVRRRVLDAIERMANAEAAASGAHTGPSSASEDFGCFGTAWHVPSVYWFVGSTDPDVYAEAKAAGRINDLPVNHSPRFAPVIHPTLQAGVEPMFVGALAWLAR